MKGAVGAALLVWFAGLAGCAQLPDIDHGVCGNGVVEPGEDCDGFPAATCNRPGQPSECRLHCDPSATNPGCPSGWGCGNDSVCRKASGQFELASSPPSDIALGLAVADFDGDRVGDVLVEEPSRFAIHFHDDGGNLARTLALPILPARPAIGELTGDGRADFAIARINLSVMRGRADRTIAPTAYAPFTMPDVSVDSVRFMTLDAVPGGSADRHAGDEILALSAQQGLWSPIDDQQLFAIPFDAALLAGEIQSGPIDERTSSPCDEFVLAFAGDDHVSIYTPCAWDASTNTAGWNKGGATVPQVTLPAGRTVGDGALLARANSDAHLDLLISAYDASLPWPEGSNVYVAYGVGDGTFHSDPTTLPPAGGDGQVAAQPILIGTELPFAAGRLNGDDALDFVTSEALMLSAPAGGSCGTPANYDCIRPASSTWSSARIADLNGNGIADVIASSSGAFRLDFFNGTPSGLLNRFSIPTNGPADLLTIGDFDGDLILDAAFRQTAPVTGNTSSEVLAVAFGQPYGAPNVPIEMGRFQHIQQITAGTLEQFMTTDLVPVLDAATDLVVLASRDEGDATSTSVGHASAAIFYGSGDRQLQSPFTIFDISATPPQPQPALRVAIGEFDGDLDHHADVAALALGNIQGLDPTQSPQAWLLPSQGEAELDSTTARRTALPTGFDPCFALMAPDDLDGDGIDEMVVLGAIGKDQNVTGILAFARSAPDPTNPDLRHWVTAGPPEVLPEVYVERVMPGELCGSFVSGQVSGGPPNSGPPTSPDAPQIDPFSLPGHIEIGDLDGDGRKDVVALGLTFDPSTGLVPKLVVFPNHGTGLLKGSERIVFGSDELSTTTGFTLINADADPALEIAVASGYDVVIYDVDLALQKLTPRTTVDYSLAELVAAGDVTGDGVQDLVVAGYDGLFVQAGIPVLR